MLFSLRYVMMRLYESRNMSYSVEVFYSSLVNILDSFPCIEVWGLVDGTISIHVIILFLH